MAYVSNAPEKSKNAPKNLKCTKEKSLVHCINIISLCQISCLICLPDKSGNFVVFGAETARNTLKQAKTGFGMAIIARPRPAICVFEPKIPRTFYFKLTEQSSRKKLAVGGFEPEKVRLLSPAPLKKPLLSTTTREVFSCI